MISGFDLTRQGSIVNFQMMSLVPVYLVNIDHAMPSTLHLPRDLPARIFFLEPHARTGGWFLLRR